MHRGRITHTLLILYLHPQTTLPDSNLGKQVYSTTNPRFGEFFYDLLSYLVLMGVLQNRIQWLRAEGAAWSMG